MSSTSYAQLYESNQQLHIKIAELESQKLGFGLFEKQIKQQLSSLTSTRAQLEQRVDVLIQQLNKQRHQYQQQLQVKQQQNVQLRLEKDSLAAQRERDSEMIGLLQERVGTIESSLLRRTEILNKCFREKSEQLELI